MSHTAKSRRLRPCARALADSLRNFLTPALWQQAHGARPGRTSPRWATQALILTLLACTWACGDSQEERFETARACAIACRPKRRRPGATVRGFHKALARLPMPVLRAVAAALRGRLGTIFARRWRIEGFIPLGCDGTRLACPRTAELEQRLGQAGKPQAAPMLWLTALVHLRLGIPWAWCWGKGTASERGHLLRLLALLPAAALVVADAGYVGYDLARALFNHHVGFLIRMSSHATLYTARAVRLDRFHEGEVYYGPGAKQPGSATKPLLRLRLIRVRGQRKGRHRGKDVWLLTNVLEPRRLSVATAAQFYRWRWENEGLFRTYKRTLAKVKLQSRTVRLVHREAEGSLLATQLLLAQGALALRSTTAGPCSARKVLLAIRDELRGTRGRSRFGQRLRAALREQRVRRSAKVKRPWPQRKEHKPPKPPRILKLTDVQKARISRQETEAA